MLVEINGVSKTYQSPDSEIHALRDIAFGVAEGEFVSIVGPSGCGKSTLLSIIAGLDAPSGGEIRVDGETLRGVSRKIGYMPQKDQLFPWRSIWDNVTLGLELQRQRDGAHLQRVKELLERYGYKQYEISNFCAPGYESRHNMKYWTLEDYMGFGPGAHSCVGNLRYSYVRDLKQYIAGVGRGVSIVDEYETIEPLERAVEYIMLGMRTAHGISERDYRIRCQYNWKPIGQTLQAFAEKGWAEKTGDRWHFTVPGYLISNTLIGILLEAQAGGRIEGPPWLSEVFEAEKKINIPKSEEELFTELYNQHTEKN